MNKDNAHCTHTIIQHIKSTKRNGIFDWALMQKSGLEFLYGRAGGEGCQKGG